MSIPRTPSRSEDLAEKKDLKQRKKNKRNPYNEHDKPAQILEKKPGIMIWTNGISIRTLQNN